MMKTCAASTRTTKWNPPLRDRAHIDACLAAVSDGTIDLISSGHQPRSLEKKMQELDNVPFGMTSLDTALSLVIARLDSTRSLILGSSRGVPGSHPAKVIGLDAGTLQVGKPGDVTLIDPDHRWIVEPSALRSRSRNTPLLLRRTSWPSRHDLGRRSTQIRVGVAGGVKSKE